MSADCMFDLKEHIACCLNSDNHFDPLVKTIDIPEGQTFIYKSGRSEVLLLISGSIELHGDQLEGLTVSAEQLFLLPCGDTVRLYGLASARLIVCGLTDEIGYCHVAVSEYKKLYNRGGRQLCVLPFKQPIARFAESLVMALESGLRCETYLNSKFTELIFLLGTCYSKYEQADLFLPILQKRSDFRVKISKIEGDVKTAKEMAAMCHMTEVGFRKKFKHEMGIPPGEYLIERKKRLISRDLRIGV